jgi:CheY-like chemotaxis protein
MPKKRILVVDDQESMRDMLADLIDVLGHEPHLVSGPHEALAALEKDQVDLVITDLNMPVMDGLRLMREIKARLPALPVIIITGYGTFHTERQVLSNGADGYISKPCTISRVQETVNAALGVS